MTFVRSITIYKVNILNKRKESMRIDDLYQKLQDIEDSEDNFSISQNMAICDICDEEKILILEFWHKRHIRYIKNGSMCSFYCRDCVDAADRVARHKRSLRIPRWSETKEIRKFYDNCPRGYEVDHIIPLCGEEVSGLHVLKNLQYLTKLENRLKSNKFSIDNLSTLTIIR